MSDYRDLVVFHKAHAMAKSANKLAISIRSSDYRSLRAQLIRSANSVPTNIVEGSGQESAKDFIRFLRYSVNSANETVVGHFGTPFCCTHHPSAFAVVVEIRSELPT
jgi:hypothetical protein